MHHYYIKQHNSMQEISLNINKIYVYKLFPTKSVLKYILLQANETNNY